MGKTSRYIYRTSVMIVSLEEYQPVHLPEADFENEWAVQLQQNYSTHVTFEPPTPFNNCMWKLTSLGNVGFIPFTSSAGLHLIPKVCLSNLFQMLDVAYKVPLNIQEGGFQAESLVDFYEQLAGYLAKRVLSRGRKGYYRTYEAYEEELPFLRERVNLANMLKAPWKIPIECNYHENTADIEDNQILAWTLETILRSGLLSSKVQPIVRQGYMELSGLVSSHLYRPNECINRFYNRLNDDYRPLHWLCRFFLEHTGPTYQIGDRLMSPFLIDMNKLFEVFVAEWLAQHLPIEWNLIPQLNVSVSQEYSLNFKIDLVIRDASSGQAIGVLDTKYKKPDLPSADDVAQIVTYAEMMGCDKGILIYPSTKTMLADTKIGTKRIASLVFDLSQDLDTAGMSFLTQLKNFIEKV